MNTKKRILYEALTLFSEKGYANVFVADIAKAVGIKARPFTSTTKANRIFSIPFLMK